MLERGTPADVFGAPAHERTRRYLSRIVEAGRLRGGRQPSFFTSSSNARSSRVGSPNRASPYGKGLVRPVRA